MFCISQNAKNNIHNKQQPKMVGKTEEMEVKEKRKVPPLLPPLPSPPHVLITLGGVIVALGDSLSDKQTAAQFT
jgi:hypothetical protein